MEEDKNAMIYLSSDEKYVR